MRIMTQGKKTDLSFCLYVDVHITNISDCVAMSLCR